MTTRAELTIKSVEFYKDLFRAKETKDCFQWFPRLILDEINFWLRRHPLEEEVWKVVASLALDKSSWSNRFTGGFFKAYWSLIKNDVMLLIQDFFNGHDTLKHINSAFVTLI